MKATGIKTENKFQNFCEHETVLTVHEKKLQGNQIDAQQISSSTLGCSNVIVTSSPSLGLDGA